MAQQLLRKCKSEKYYSMYKAANAFNYLIHIDIYF